MTLGEASPAWPWSSADPYRQRSWGLRDMQIVSWSQLQLDFELQLEAVRTSSRQRDCGRQWPPVEQSSRMRKKCCYSQRNLGSICCSLFCLQLTSHTQPFENKVWEVHFSKDVCSFVNIVYYVSAYICIRIVVSRLYNNVNIALVIV